MQQLWLSASFDIIVSLRSRWFMIHTLVFGALLVILFVFAVAESRLFDYSGFSRLLVTYIQLTMALLPIFILYTTVCSMAGDRRDGVSEYVLSLPLGLGSWFWGRLCGRFVVVCLPVLLAMMAATIWFSVRGVAVSLQLLVYYSGLLMALSWCFLGIGTLISGLTRSSGRAQGAAFLVWLILLLFLDLILLGVMIQHRLPAETAVMIALANPLQVFRIATLMLVDPQLVLLGPTAYVILDTFGETGYLVYAISYPILLGGFCASLGYLLFRRSDLS